MDIKKGTNCFYIGETEENATAKISYVLSDDNTLIANSTHVGEEWRGQGVAGNSWMNWLITPGRKALKLYRFVAMCKKSLKTLLMMM